MRRYLVVAMLAAATGLGVASAPVAMSATVTLAFEDDDQKPKETIPEKPKIPVVPLPPCTPYNCPA